MTEWIGYLAGLLTTVGYVPQLWKIWRTHKAGDISFPAYLLLLFGLLLWLCYGIASGNWPVIAANGVSAACVAVILWLKRRWG